MDELIFSSIQENGPPPGCSPSGNWPPQVGRPAEPPPVPSSHPIHVLLVEDHLDTLDALTQLLEICGFVVKPTLDACEALRLLAAEKIDVLVSDLRLPGMDGLELMHAAHASNGVVRGISMSGSSEAADVEQSRLAGFSEHLIKPVDLDLLEASIRRMGAESRQAEALHAEALHAEALHASQGLSVITDH